MKIRDPKSYYSTEREPIDLRTLVLTEHAEYMEVTDES